MLASVMPKQVLSQHSTYAFVLLSTTKKATHFCAAFLCVDFKEKNYLPTPRALSRPSINLPFSITEKLPV